jgi:hypothetical protein
MSGYHSGCDPANCKLHTTWHRYHNAYGPGLSYAKDCATCGYTEKGFGEVKDGSKPALIRFPRGDESARVEEVAADYVWQIPARRDDETKP